MSKDNDPLMAMLTSSVQETFDFYDSTRNYDVVRLEDTVEGFGLYKQTAPHGGSVYYTDEFGVASEVWDTGVDNIITVFAALTDTGEGETLWRHLGEVYGYTRDSNN